jgi:GNAT superfamily N-acetyltransferase
MMQIIEETKGDYTLSNDPSKIQLEVIHNYLSKESYWAKNIPFETCKRSIENSIGFAIYHKGVLVAFARIITDQATIAYLGDVFVLEEHRGKGLSKWMMDVIINHPDLQGLRRWILGTRDAHELYRQYGFTGILKPERFMEKVDLNPYGGESC